MHLIYLLFLLLQGIGAGSGFHFHYPLQNSPSLFDECLSAGTSRYRYDPISCGTSSASITRTSTALFHYRQRRASSTTTSSRIASSSPNRNVSPRQGRGFFKRQIDRFFAPFRRFYKAIYKRFFQRYTVYVLECDHGKYYVGSTSNRRQRFREHSSRRGGSAWTRLHRPQRVLREYRNIPRAYLLGMEATVTAQTMLEYGIRHVRGAMFSQPREYTIDDLPALAGFLGHYNDLDYGEVTFRLERELLVRSDQGKSEVSTDSGTYDTINGNSATKKKRKRKKKRNPKEKDSDRCFNCGERGHWASECPKMWANWDDI